MLFLNPMPRVRTQWADKIAHPIAFIRHIREESKAPLDERCNCWAAFLYISIFETVGFFIGGFAIGWASIHGLRSPTPWLLAAIAVLCKTVSLLSERVFGWEDWNSHNRKSSKAVKHILMGSGDPSELLQNLLNAGVPISDMRIERVEREDPNEDPVDRIIRESQAEYRKRNKGGNGGLPS